MKPVKLSLPKENIKLYFSTEFWSLNLNRPQETIQMNDQIKALILRVTSKET